MGRTEPKPNTLTLRFKQQRTTILIEVDELQHLSEVRTELLRALQDTNPSGKLNGHDIPQNPDLLLLGQAVDRNDLTQGFMRIETEEEGSEQSGKGKGKTNSAAGPKSGTAQIKDCPKGRGLKDADVLAFKFKNELGEDDSNEVEHWDVAMPTMEDTYPEEEAQQDEGVGMEEG